MRNLSFLTTVISALLAFTNSAHSSEYIDSAESVIVGNCLADYRSKYKKMPKRKSFAIASDEDDRQVCAWYGRNTFSGSADWDALIACEKRRKKSNIQNECVVVDRDGKLVVKKGVLPEWPHPGYDMPVGQEYIDLHDKAMGVLEGRACQRSFRRYMLHGGFKAFAYTVSDRGGYPVCAYYSRRAPDLAQSLALEKCNERRAKVYPDKPAAECKLFALNNDILLSRTDYGMRPYNPDSLTRARRLHLSTITELVRNGEDVNQVDYKGRSALFYSVETNRLDVVRYLVSNGADVNLAANNGNTPLKEAKRRKYKDIARFLEQKGALETPVETEKPAEDLDLSDIRPVQPETIPGPTMTTELVLQFLKSMQATQKPLDQIQAKLKSNKEANKLISGAVTKGEMLRTMVAIADKAGEIENVAAAVKESGFESIEDWAYTGDRILSVMFVNEMLNAIAPLSFSAKGFPEDAEIFEFITNESNPQELRNELSVALEETCQSDCVVPADLAAVSKHLAEIKSAFEGM